ncbi:MAG TPA: serine/threonine-protein kinase, partial [Polyangiaceae bacterium]|nr:serine/threonine-protein kinase [Polyangiaceae bacterium]
ALARAEPRPMGDTMLQFGGALAKDADVAEPRAGRRCPVCQQHFSSSDACFCPFDGEPLVDAQDYDPGLDPLLGTIVDQRYEVQSALGEGGMGTVYKVRHVALGKGFALKALRADLATDGEIAERFIGEARTAAAVSHPGLVQITDFGQLSDGRPYFVMELLEGSPLSWFIDKGALPAARAVGIVRQVAEAVAAAHRAGIVHRDLKPDNVHLLVDKDGTDRVKVLDFGLAKVMGKSRRTRDGIVFGTPHYMSPEQAAGEPVDHRADIYALGIVMYEMLTGRVPFEADSFMGVLSKHIYMQPTPPSQVVKSAREVGALERIVLKCLEKKPRQRYQSFDEMLADLALAMASGAIAPLAEGSSIRASGEAFELRLPGGPGFAARALSGAGRSLPLAPLWPLLGVAALVLLMIVGFMVVRATRHPSAAAAASMEKPPPAAVGVMTVPTDAVVEPVSPAAPAQVSRERSGHAKPGQPLATTSSPSVHGKSEAAPVRSSVTRRPGGVRGEIVDPWAQ